MTMFSVLCVVLALGAAGAQQLAPVYPPTYPPSIVGPSPTYPGNEQLVPTYPGSSSSPSNGKAPSPAYPGNIPAPSPISPAPVVADNQAVARLAFVLSPAVFAQLCSDATARGAFADDAAAAMATQLMKSSGSAISVSGSVPASACGRRLRALLQSSTTMPVNFLITFPPGTNAAAQASQVQNLVTRINTEGVAALG
ncbi:hypothetical protein HaLaN_14308, partial [Haematococcus lacustris]